MIWVNHARNLKEYCPQPHLRFIAIYDGYTPPCPSFSFSPSSNFSLWIILGIITPFASSTSIKGCLFFGLLCRRLPVSRRSYHAPEVPSEPLTVYHSRLMPTSRILHAVLELLAPMNIITLSVTHILPLLEDLSDLVLLPWLLQSTIFSRLTAMLEFMSE